MNIIPAIDLMDYRCVRLYQGNFRECKYYDFNIVEKINYWKKLGVTRIHVIDLDLVLRNGKNNFHILKDILKTGIEIEFGGGIYTNAFIKLLFDSGIHYVILGSILLYPAIVKESLKLFGNERLICSLDSNGGYFASDGWQTLNVITTKDFGVKIKDYGFKNCIYTDTKKDGTLSGINKKDIEEFSEITNFENITYAGGVSNKKDIEELSEIQNVKGVILGKALHENKLNIEDLLEYSNTFIK